MRVDSAVALLVEALELAEGHPAAACRSVHDVVVVGLPVADARELLELLRRVELALGGPPSQSVNHNAVTGAVSRRLGLGNLGKPGTRKRRT